MNTVQVFAPMTKFSQMSQSYHLEISNVLSLRVQVSLQYFLKGVDNYNNMSLAQIVLTVT